MIRTASARFSRYRAFSLVEMLAVMAIVLVLTIAAGPSVGALRNAGAANRAAADLQRTLEGARSYAMTHQTYVRLAIGELPAGRGNGNGGTVVLPLYSADGTLVADGPADMADTAKWPALGRALVLENFAVSDALNASAPDTAQDTPPSATDVADFQREAGGAAGEVTFDAVVQFRPDGLACVKGRAPVRQVKIGLDLGGAQAGRNPIILRLAGNTGAVQILRAEDGVR